MHAYAVFCCTRLCFVQNAQPGLWPLHLFNVLGLFFFAIFNLLIQVLTKHYCGQMGSQLLPLGISVRQLAVLFTFSMSCCLVAGPYLLVTDKGKLSFSSLWEILPINWPLCLQHLFRKFKSWQRFVVQKHWCSCASKKPKEKDTTHKKKEKKKAEKKRKSSPRNYAMQPF